MKQEEKEREEREERKILLELRKENSAFLNKAMLAIPAIVGVALLPMMPLLKDGHGKNGIFVGLIFFIFSVLALLFSYFTSEEAIDARLRDNETQEVIFDGRTRKLHIASYLLIFLGFICIIFGVYSIEIKK